MSVRGLHLLLTYKCNARCGHCFLNAGPEHRDVMPQALGLSLIDQASQMPSVNHLFIEGGEPFLFPELVKQLVKHASDRGLWIGALTNGFWALDPDKAKAVLAPMVEAGLQSLSISTDAWHERFVPVERVKIAAAAARDLELDADVMFCQSPDFEYTNLENLQDLVGATEVHAGGIVCRGRAATDVCVNGNLDWQSLSVCRENLASPGRVHIGPNGEIHLCQGLLLGPSAKSEPLEKIFAGYKPESHPIVAKLLAGGPASLARYANARGWRPAPGYVDACQLCYEVRTFLGD